MKCFYHSADLDGHCSGAIVKYVNPDCEMIGINYGQPFPWELIEKDEVIFMVDFCLQPFKDMERLNSMCRLVWIDHHASSINEAISRDFKASDAQMLLPQCAACELTWKFFHATERMPDAVYYLGRHDVWDHSNVNTLPFQYGFRLFEDTRPDNTAFWSNVFSYTVEQTDSIILTGRTILAYEKQQNAKFCKAYAFETVLYVDPAYTGNTKTSLLAICANRGFTNSKLFDSVYDSDYHDLMITFVRLKPPAYKWTVSLYSTKPDIDCGAIAKIYGGGGHKGAAGFQCEALPFSV